MCLVNDLLFEKHYFKSSPFIKMKLDAYTPWGWIYHIKARHVTGEVFCSWEWCLEENGRFTQWDAQGTQEACIRACNTHFKAIVLECIKEETAPQDPVKDPDGDKPICKKCGGTGTQTLFGETNHCPDCKGCGRIHDYGNWTGTHHTTTTDNTNPEE